MNILLRLKLILIKLTRYEFWPFWLFYLPIYFYGFFLAIRSGSATYFTATNPGMKYGGAFDMLKFDVLQKIDPEYVPLGILVQSDSTEAEIIHSLNEKRLGFPVVAKPNIGERGKDVELIEDIGGLGSYLADRKGDFILQEYVDYPIELGILYYRLPDGSKKEITSVMIRDFLKVHGDGKKTLKELLEGKTRALFRRKYLFRKYHEKLNMVIPKGEELLVEPIGNHNRGTCFLNGNHLINDMLLEVVSGIVSSFDGFDYGRLDLKTTSTENLLKGKDIRILELNGVSSEPAHIYDPDYKLFHAYNVIIRHMNIIFRISRMNHQNGIPCAPFGAFVLDLKNHLYPQPRHDEYYD